MCFPNCFPMLNYRCPAQPSREKGTMAIRPIHVQISRHTNMSSCSFVSVMTSWRKCCTLAARLPRCCSKNFKVKTGSGAEKDPDAEPPIEDEAPEPTNEAEVAMTDALGNPEAELAAPALAEPALPKAKPAGAAITELAAELAEPAEAATATFAPDADPLASINIQNREFKLLAR
jgi:hypothetical protein